MSGSSNRDARTLGPLASSLGLLLVLAVAPAASAAIRWEQDLTRAQQIARQHNRLLLLHFWSDDCPPCRRVELNVFPRSDVRRSVESGYVPVKIHVKRSPQLARRFKVNSWPTDIIMTPDGQELLRSISKQNPNDYIAWLDGAAAHHRVRMQAPAAPGYVKDNRTGGQPRTAFGGSRYGGQTFGASNNSASPFNNRVPAQPGPAAGGSRYANPPQAQITPNPYLNNGGAAGRTAQPNPTAPAYPQQRVNQFAPAYGGQAPARRRIGDAGGGSRGPVSRYGNPQPAPPAGVGQAGYGAYGQPAPPQTNPAASGSRYGSSQGGYPNPPPAGTGGGSRYGNAGNVGGGSRYGAPAASSAPPAAAPPAAAPPAGAPPAAAGPAANAPGYSNRTPGSYAPGSVGRRQSPPPTNRSSPNLPGQGAANGQPPLALDGYCPVTLADIRKWKPGQPKWSVVHRGRTYYCAGPNEQARFQQTPDFFSPVLSGYDPVRFLEQGQFVNGQRHHGVWYNNVMYLFADEGSLQQFAKTPDRYVAQVQQAMQNTNIRR